MVCNSQGKGTMHTYWLTGIYSAEANIPVDTDDFRKLLCSNGHIYRDDSGEERLHTDESSDGKVSVADSGIICEPDTGFTYERRRSSHDIRSEDILAYVNEELCTGTKQHIDDHIFTTEVMHAKENEINSRIKEKKDFDRNFEVIMEMNERLS